MQGYYIKFYHLVNRQARVESIQHNIYSKLEPKTGCVSTSTLITARDKKHHLQMGGMSARVLIASIVWSNSKL